MLPFLKKQVAQPGLLIKTRQPDESTEESDHTADDAIEACAKDLIDAVHMKDTKAAASAIRAAFDILGSEEENHEPMDSAEESAAE